MAKVQELQSDGALVLGNARDLAASVEQRPGVVETVAKWPKSSGPRGLVIKELKITKTWDKVLWMFDTTSEIYFTGVSFDLSESKPVIMPPKDIDPETIIYKLSKGESINFTLGEGAPLFPPRVLTGGLIVYLMVFESDASSRDLGQMLNKVHEDLTADKSIMEKIKKLIKNPGATVADEALSIATAALQPLATVLKENNNDFVAPFQGYWKADDSWDGKLAGTGNGVSITLAEVN